LTQNAPIREVRGPNHLAHNSQRMTFWCSRKKAEKGKKDEGAGRKGMCIRNGHWQTF